MTILNSYNSSSSMFATLKPGKEHIIPDALSCLARANIVSTEPSYSELDALFVHNTTLVDIHPTLAPWYHADAWWSRPQHRVQGNDELGADASSLPFLSGSMPRTDVEPYG